jgi:hypothetical protein
VITPGGPPNLTDEQFEQLLLDLQSQLKLREPTAAWLGNMLPQMKWGTELHRMPGGRADEMAPARGPSTNSMIGPGPVAPWLPVYEELQDQMPVQMIRLLPKFLS